MDSLECRLHKANDDDFMQIVLTTGIPEMIKTKNRGIISVLLSRMIDMHLDYNVDYILNALTNYTYMKRDYFKPIQYFYSKDYRYAEYIFLHNILGKHTPSTEYIVTSANLDYMIEHKMFKLIKHLDGVFIETNNKSYTIQTSDKLNLRHSINREPFLKEVETYIGTFIQDMACYLNNPYNEVIDGGSVIHNRNNQKPNIDDLIAIAKKCSNPIVVIHHRHLKTFPNMLEMFSKNNIPYYLTPRGYNDDMFILWFFLKSEGAFIVTNDKYRDHIYTFETLVKKTNTQFNQYIKQQTLNYNCNKMWIAEKPVNSRCIQKTQNSIYVPHTNGGCIEIEM